jgi:polysaccharide deacetylase 2 family uncharacterized protein YibQ
VNWPLGSTQNEKRRAFTSLRSSVSTPESERAQSRRHPLLNLAIFAAIAIAALIGSAGCRKDSRPRSAEIHDITREFAAAVKSEGPLDVSVRTVFNATDNLPESTDQIAIFIRPQSSDAARSADSALVMRALDTVATRHELARSGYIETREGLAFEYLRGDFPVHKVHITTGTQQAAAPSEETPAASAPRLAIILDDLGQDVAAADAIFALPYPLTISVLPNNPHSVEIAQEARRRGYEVMLHLPMESVSQRRAESAELRPGMSQRQVSALVSGFIDAVPGVAGVNNHQGSESTANVALMNELMPVLREHKLFYIDSRTTAATVAFDAARRAGVPTAYRNVPFLDDVENVSAVSKQLRLALREVHEKNEAIAIGHPHPATLKALQEVLPEAKTQGIRLVYASDLVR